MCVCVWKQPPNIHYQEKCTASVVFAKKGQVAEKQHVNLHKKQHVNLPADVCGDKCLKFFAKYNFEVAVRNKKEGTTVNRVLNLPLSQKGLESNKKNVT